MIAHLDLTETAPMKFDTARMMTEVEKAEEFVRWLAHYDKGLSRGLVAKPLWSLGGKMEDPEDQRPSLDFSKYKPTPLLEKLPYFKEILESFKCPKGRVRILRLEAGAGIGEHRDVGAEVANRAFGQVRLHIPIVTNPDVVFVVGGERIHMKEGHLYYVNFTKKHHVENNGKTARLHLVMDLKINDWMDTVVFPPNPPMDRIEGAIQKAVLPTVWRSIQWRVRFLKWSWSKWEGSRLQKIKGSFRKKS